MGDSLVEATRWRLNYSITTLQAELYWHRLRVCGQSKHLSSDIYPQLSSNPDAGFDGFSESTYSHLGTIHLAETIVHG